MLFNSLQFCAFFVVVTTAYYLLPWRRKRLQRDFSTMLAILLDSGVPESEAFEASRGFRDSAPLSAADAATEILDGVRSGTWRILIGADADGLDRFVRAFPDDAYDYGKLAQAARESRSDGR